MRRLSRYPHRSVVSILSGLLTLTSVPACTRSGDQGVGDTTAAVNVGATPRPPSDSASLVRVYKSPTCTCCTAWVDHMRQSGFRVLAIDTTDLDAIKRRYRVAAEHAACHTATVGGYVVEGHVPAEDVRRLLAERPSVTGLAVPGMPVGSPGMEGTYKEAYEVLAFTHGSTSTVFAKH